MTLRQLQEQRSGKVAAMQNIQEKGDKIVALDISAMKTIGDEIKAIDDQIEALELTRQYAINNVKPKEDKKSDFVALQRTEFSAYLRGKSSFHDYRQKIVAAGAYDPNVGKELVPPEFVNIMKERVLEYGIIVPALDRIDTSGTGVLSYPTMDDTANGALWIDEHGTILLDDFATGTIEMNAFKLGTGVLLSNELVEDSTFNIIVYSANLMGIRLGRTLEAAVINGDGVKKPLGILNTVAISGTVKAIAEVNTATAGTFVLSDLDDLIAGVQPTQRAGAKFYLSDSALLLAAKEKDANGRKLLQPLSTATDAKDVVYEYSGYPIVVNAELGDANTTDDTIAFFGNVKNYTLRVVRDVTVKASDQVKILTDETVVLGTMRVDGRVTSINECFSKLIVSVAT